MSFIDFLNSKWRNRSGNISDGLKVLRERLVLGLEVGNDFLVVFDDLMELWN